jgi:hypothetical protein
MLTTEILRDFRRNLVVSGRTQVRSQPGDSIMRSFSYIAVTVSLVATFSAMTIVETVVALDTAGPSSKPSGADASEIPFMIRKLPEVRFDAAPLDEVIEFLADVTSHRFEVDWAAIEEAGYARTAPVNARLRDVALSKGLEIMLRDVSSANPQRSPLTYEEKDGVVTIATERKFYQTMPTVKYDVGDLLAMAAVFPHDGTVSEQLIWTVRQSVDRPSWDRKEFPATIRIEGNDMIVRQRLIGHKEIDQLLRRLRDPDVSQPIFVARRTAAPTTAPATQRLGD